MRLRSAGELWFSSDLFHHHRVDQLEGFTEGSLVLNEINMNSEKGALSNRSFVFYLPTSIYHHVPSWVTQHEHVCLGSSGLVQGGNVEFR